MQNLLTALLTNLGQAVTAAPKVRIRREHKFMVRRQLLVQLTADLAPFVVDDSHNIANCHYYKVASIYFDNHALRNYLDKVNGLARRLKTRVRFYPSSSTGMYFVEFKYKQGDLSVKHKSQVTETDIKQLLAGNYPSFFKSKNQVLTSFARHLFSNSMFPFVRIDYVRQAFLAKYGLPLRITIDSQVRCCRYRKDFYGHAPHIRALPANSAILEIKTEGTYPFWLVAILQKYGLKQEAVSKYVYSVQALARTSSLSL